MYIRDTIAAIATAAGPSAVGIVRISGPDAAQVGAKLFQRDTCHWEPHKLTRVAIYGTDGKTLDDGLASLMRSPRSYTGEDVVEVQGHGSPAVLQATLQAAFAAGARPAEPGEFTKRAFLNGKLDLAQAEAVMDLVRCRTPSAANLAADQLSGALSRHLGSIKNRLIGLKGHLEVLIDFTEEDVDLDPDAVTSSASVLQRDLEALLKTYQRGRIYREGLRITISGRPNVGKSSLLNALARSERAIVTDIAGTTRDVIEESIDLGGVPVVISDTAGMRQATDRVEEIGIERARNSAAAADVVLAVVDQSQPYQEPPELGHAEQRTLLVINKIDLPSRWDDVQSADAIRVSARTGQGIEDLERAILGITEEQWSDALPPLTNTRQRDAIAKVAESVRQATEAARAGHPPDIVAVDIQLALDQLGTVTGEIINDDVLDLVFREFCMGK